MKQTYAYISLMILLLALCLGGCASPKPYVSNPKMSEAQNIIKAAGMVHNLDIVAPDNGSLATNVAGAVTHSMSHGGSLLASAGLRGGVSFLGGLVLGSRDPEAYSKIVAWMPKEMATSPEEAKGKMDSMLSAALWDALKETPFPDGYSPNKTAGTDTFLIEGNGCVNKPNQGVCRYAFTVSAPEVLPAPDFLNGGESWAWTLHKWPIGLSPATFSGDRKPHFPDYQVYEKMSAKLPEWVYIYLAPSFASWRVSVERPGGTYGFLSMPVVLNKGNTLYFLRRK